MWEILLSGGIISGIVGLIFWWFKKWIEKRDKEKEEHDKNVENLILYLIKTSTSTNILSEATARAVQRIPDARCNGDMKAALEKASKIHKEEKEFLIDQGLKHIFEN